MEANQVRPVACRANPVTTSGLPPQRSASMPTTGASSMGAAVQGSTRMPAAKGERPCTVWRNWVRKKMEPNMPKLNSMAVTLTAVKPRWRKRRMSNMGWDDRSSQATKPRRAIEPSTKELSTEVLVQPWLFPLTRPNTTPKRPALTRPTPARSSLDGAPRDSDSFHQASGMSTMPTGTFNQKMYCHDHPLVDRSPDQRAEGHGGPADGPPDAQGGVSPLRWHGRAEQGQ